MTVVAVTVVLVTALALILAVRGYHTLLEETFRERSLSYVHAFAASAGAWIDPLDVEMLRAASRFLLVGSASYVLIELSGDSIVDERGEEAFAAELPAASSRTTDFEDVRLAGGEPVLDVIVPLIVSGKATGSVRIGIETTTVVSRGRSMTMAAGATAVGVDLLVLGLLFWSHRRSTRRGRDKSIGRDPWPNPDPDLLVIGDLRIDGATKTVALKGRPVELTPKQYALLDFLARHPGRVVSEREIVDGVWTESPYADSKDVKQYVYLLRKRLAKADSRGRDLIVTVPGFGYRLTSAPVDDELTDA